MYIEEFDYHLPENLIAYYPLPQRSSSRLLHLDKKLGTRTHYQFTDLLHLLSADDLLVFNDTRVMPARLYAVKESGGKVEILVERIIDSKRAWAHVRASKSPKPNTLLIINHEVMIKVLGRDRDLFELELIGDRSIMQILTSHGHIPLPLYIKRTDEYLDQERYQTVYAKHDGSVAAPTAGLHFDEALLQAVAERGIEAAFITLHVGAGTFQSIRTANILDHRMHAEYFEISQQVCEQIKNTRERGGRVIAVGTTTVRSLETLAQMQTMSAYQGNTTLFIYPGYKFRCIDGMISNFHLPKTSLLMLVCALAGKENTLQAYQEAIARQYRFYSYGDAMLIV